MAQAERRPALAVIASEEFRVGGETLARRSAERYGAEIAVLDGLGHWWMRQDPARGAAALATFFASLD